MRQLIPLRTLDAYDPGGTGILATATVEDSLVLVDTISVPGWAKYATFYLNATAMAGAAETIDHKLAYIDPGDFTTATDLAGGGITQITAAGAVVVQVTPDHADDDVAPLYFINTLLPGQLKSTLTLGSSTVLEVQTVDLADVADLDTFRIATGAGQTLKTAVITVPTGSGAAAGAPTAALMETELNVIYGAGTVTVTAVDANSFTVDYLKNFDPVLMQVTDPVGFTAKADVGYVLGVITTTAATVGDETYTLTLSVLFNS